MEKKAGKAQWRLEQVRCLLDGAREWDEQLSANVVGLAAQPLTTEGIWFFHRELERVSGHELPPGGSICDYATPRQLLQAYEATLSAPEPGLVIESWR